MSGNDVRVRLTTEGVAEVVRALKTVENRAKRANREAASGVGALGKQLASVRGLVAGLGTGAAAVGIASLGRSTLQFADDISKLSQRTGITTESLSGLALAGSLADVEFSALQRTFSRLPQTLDDLRTGGESAERAFANLQLTAADFSGLSLDASLELIAQRIAGLPAGVKKATLAVDIFGKSGGELIPLLDELGRVGIAGLIKNSNDLGVTVSREFGLAAEAANDATTEMGKRLQGLSTQFLTGFLPSVLSSLGQFDDAVADKGVSSIQKFGEMFGFLFRVGSAAFTGLADVALDFINLMKNNVVTLGRIIQSNLQLDPAGALKILVDRAEGLAADGKQLADNLVKNAKAIAAAFETPPPLAPTGGGAGGGDPGGNDGLVDPAEVKRTQAAAETARLAAIRSGLSDEALIRNASASRQSAQDDRQFEQGLISLDDYIARRRAAVVAGAAAETAALRTQLQAVQSQSATDGAARAVEVATIRAQIAAADIAAAQELDAIEAERIDNQIAGARTRLEVEGQLADIEGRKADSARIALELQTQALEKQLRLAGATEAVIDATVGRFAAATEARQGFENIVTQAEAAFSQLDTARTRIEQDVELGISTQLGGQTRILQIEQARLPVLQSLVLALQQAAAATGDPAAIAQAEALSLKVREVSVSVELAANSFARFRDQAEQSAVGSLTEFLDNGITQAKSLKDAFRAMALSVINDLKRIAAQALATAIVRGIGGAFSAGAGAGGGGGGGGGFAAGGLLRGPGSSTSDSIPAWLSHGEYVVRAAAVRRPGNLARLEAMNAGRVKGFARGGLADIMPRFAAGGLAEAGTTGSFRGRLEVGLADGLEARSTPVSDDLIIDVIRRNPRRIGELIR